MDIREKSKFIGRAQQQVLEEGNTITEDEMTDSLIFNIMKKIQLRERLIEEYKKEKEQTNKSLLTKYFIHSKIPMYYASLMGLVKLAKIIYMKPGQAFSTVLTVPNLLFHVCVFLSLNEYYKYQNIFYLKHEMGEQYRIYQRNVQQLMEQKVQKFSLLKKISKTDFLDQDKLIEIFRYRLVV